MDKKLLMLNRYFQNKKMSNDFYIVRIIENICDATCVMVHFCYEQNYVPEVEQIKWLRRIQMDIERYFDLKSEIRRVWMD